MLMMNSNLSKLLRFVKIVVRFYLNPKSDDTNLLIDFIYQFII